MPSPDIRVLTLTEPFIKAVYKHYILTVSDWSSGHYFVSSAGCDTGWHTGKMT